MKRLSHLVYGFLHIFVNAEVSSYLKEIEKKSSSLKMSKVFSLAGLLASSGLLADSPLFTTLFIDCFRMHIFKNFPFAYLNFDLRATLCIALLRRIPFSTSLLPSTFYHAALSCRYLPASLKVSVWKSWIDLRQATLEIFKTQMYKGGSLPNGNFSTLRKSDRTSMAFSQQNLTNTIMISYSKE